MSWKEEKGPWPFHQWSNWENDWEEPSLPAVSPRYCLSVAKSSMRLMLLHSLTQHCKRLCTNTLKGISLSQKEHMSFVPNGNGFSAQTILSWHYSNNHLLFSKRTPLNKEKDSLISVYSLDQSAVTKWQSLVLMDTETGDRSSQEGPHVQRNCLVKNSLKDNLKRTTEGVYSDFPYCTYAKRPN